MVDGGNVAPVEARERERDGGHWWKGLHHRLGVGACTQKAEMPKARAGGREKNKGLSARALGPHRVRFDFVAFACC